MSPVSRRRKVKKKRTPKPSEPRRSDVAEPSCTCPTCSGEMPGPATVVDAFMAIASDLSLSDDPLDAEMVGSTILGVPAIDRDAVGLGMVDLFIPIIEERANADALALLLALASVAEDEVAAPARAAAGRLAATGIQPPRWAGGLDEPVTCTEHRRLELPDHGTVLLACEFRRGRGTQRILVTVDDVAGWIASDIALLAEPVPKALEFIAQETRSGGRKAITDDLDPAEFRRQVEDALDARLELDFDHPIVDDENDEDGPGYYPKALFLRRRLEALPNSDRSDEPDIGIDLASLDEFMKLIASNRAGMQPAPPATPAKLPPKRKQSDGRAPVFQIKVSLSGAKPPIWRRLEVPADIALSDLHDVIQIAFGWNDSHMHAFDTDLGGFGRPDPELGQRSDRSVTLEQVAGGEKARIGYTYDFGDDWRHEIVVEKVVDPKHDVQYPRCTGGRRAAPPEDSGGIWGYANLVEILDDPGHPDHDDQLEWLGLDSADEFDPAMFDAPAVNGVLARLR